MLPPDCCCADHVGDAEAKYFSRAAAYEDAARVLGNEGILIFAAAGNEQVRVWQSFMDPSSLPKWALDCSNACPITPEPTFIG